MSEPSVFAGLVEADLAFVELMAGLHVRLAAMLLAFPAGPKRTAIEAAQIALARLTVSAIDAGKARQ